MKALRLTLFVTVILMFHLLPTRAEAMTFSPMSPETRPDVEVENKILSRSVHIKSLGYFPNDDGTQTIAFATGMGVLVNPKWILTTAHMVDFIMEANLRRIAFVNGRSVPLKGGIAHPSWANGKQIANDIGLLELTEEMNDYIGTIEFSPSDSSSDYTIVHYTAGHDANLFAQLPLTEKFTQDVVKKIGTTSQLRSTFEDENDRSDLNHLMNGALFSMFLAPPGDLLPVGATGIRHLGIMHTAINKDHHITITRNPDIHSVKVVDIQWSLDDVSYIFNGMHNVRTLRLISMNLDDATVTAILDALPNAQELDEIILSSSPKLPAPRLSPLRNAVLA
jgi:hypothetical protein